METILANAVSKPKRVKHRGREWLVTSASLIVPGVLKGSQGALYYPPDEIAANHWAWNGMPIVVGHPLKDGVHVSARDPDILERFGIGHVYRANANGKLAAEAWFDVNDVRNYDKRESTHILSDLEAGKVVELSTGLETHNHPSEGTYNGVAYTHVARNYRPDHLALLLGEKGACSASDGCGFNVNANTDHDGLVTAVDSLLETLVNAGVYGNPQSKNTGKFKKLGAGTGKGEIHESAQRGHVVVTDKQRELGAEAKTQADAGQNPPSWAVDEPTWERAKAAADKGEYGEDSYYAVVTHIYEKMGGTIQGEIENAETVTNSQVTNETIEESPMTREQKTQYLTTNCDCWKGKTTTLNKLDDKELDELLANVQKEAKDRKAQQTVVNQLKEGVSLGGTAATLTVNAAGRLVVRNAPPTEEAAVECAPNDMKCLEMMASKKKVENIDGDDCEGEGQDSECRKMFSEMDARNTANSRRRKPTLKEWEDSMPMEAREVWNAAKATEHNERKKLVGVLVGNIRDDGQRQAKAKKLMARSTVDLREQVELVQAAIAANVQTRDTVVGNNGEDYSFDYQPTLYAGDGPAPNGYQGYQLTDNEANDVLPDPSDTYAASGYNDPTINAGEGVVRHFRPERKTRTRQQRQEAEVEEIA